MIITALAHLAPIAYAAAAAVYLAWLVRPRAGLPAIGRAFLCAGLGLHVVSLALEPQGGQLFSMISAALVAGFVALDLRYRLPVAGAFVAPLTLAIMLPAHLSGAAGYRLGHELTQSAVLALHVGASALGTCALALAFTLALVYLAGEAQLKRKQPARLFARLPSLQLIDRVCWLLVAWGFAFLSVSLATGPFASEAKGAFFAFAPKQAFALGAWTLLAVLVQARLVAGWRGRRVAVLVLAGCVLLAGAYGGMLWSTNAARAALGRI